MMGVASREELAPTLMYARYGCQQGLSGVILTVPLEGKASGYDITVVYEDSTIYVHCTAVQYSALPSAAQTTTIRCFLVVMFVVLRENEGDNYISLGPHPVRSCTCHMACHHELLARKCDVSGAIPFTMKGLATEANDWKRG